MYRTDPLKDDGTFDILAERCSDSIYNSKQGKEFESFAKSLNNSINNLYNEIPTN